MGRSEHNEDTVAGGACSKKKGENAEKTDGHKVKREKSPCSESIAGCNRVLHLGGESDGRQGQCEISDIQEAEL